MIRQWKEFEVGTARYYGTDRRYVTMSKRGIILINRKTVEDMGKPEGIVMLYDERYQTIGIRPAAAGTKNFIPLKEKKGVTHRTIYAYQFCRHFKLKPTGTIVFTKPELDHDGVLLLELHSASEV
jgi:hypothetical protein